MRDYTYFICEKRRHSPRVIVTHIEELNTAEKVKTWHFSLITESIQKLCT